MWRSVKARAGTLGTTNIRVELLCIHGLILVPLLIVGILFTALSTLANEQPRSWPIDRLRHGLLVGLPMGVLNALKYAVVWLIVRHYLQRPLSIGVNFNAWAIACGFVAGMFYGIFAYLIFMWGFLELYSTLHNAQLITVVGPPVALFLFALTSFLEIGLQRENMDESVREWWASLAGWIGIYGVGWLIVFGLTLGGPRRSPCSESGATRHRAPPYSLGLLLRRLALPPERIQRPQVRTATCLIMWPMPERQPS